MSVDHTLLILLLLMSKSSALDVDKTSGLLAATLDYWKNGLNFNFVMDVDDEEAAAALIVSTMSSSSQDSPWNIVYDNRQDHIDLDQPGHKVSLILVTPRNRLSFRQASTGGIMRKGVWIVPHHLMDPYQVKSRFDSNILTYNVTNGSVNLSEVFSVKDSHKFLNDFGYWSEEEGLVIHQPHMWERRQGFLKGVKLIGMHLPWPPYTYIEEDEYGNTTTYGILPDAIKMFQQIAGEIWQYSLWQI